MLVRLMEQEMKPIKQVVADADIKRGTPLEDGKYFADVQKTYDGVNAAIEPGELDFEDIKTGTRYNRIPVVLGERYATTELTVGSLAVGDTLGVSGGKFAAGSGNFIYGGEYANPYGVKMYIVERV